MDSVRTKQLSLVGCQLSSYLPVLVWLLIIKAGLNLNVNEILRGLKERK